MNNKIKTVILVVVIALVNIGCDQITKNYARKNIQGRDTINVVGNLVVLKYAENDGGFLSMGANLPQSLKTAGFVVLPIIILTILIVYLVTKQLSLPQIVCISFVVGGGISNTIDRITNNGLVTDFLNFGIGNIRTGILNFADMSITFGVIFLVLIQLIENKKV